MKEGTSMICVKESKGEVLAYISVLSKSNTSEFFA